MLNMGTQLQLDITSQPIFDINNYIISDYNQEICDYVANWQPTCLAPTISMLNKWHNITIIHGSKGYGKSFITKYWQCISATAVRIIAGNELLNYNLSQLSALNNTNLAIDSTDSLFNNKPQLLLHLVNLFQQSNKLLLITCCNAHLSSNLADLNSRWQAILTLSFKPLNETELMMFWQHQQSQRQLKIEPAVTKYILSRIARTPASIINIIAHLDTYAAQEQSKVTIPMVKKLFQTFF